MLIGITLLRYKPPVERKGQGHTEDRRMMMGSRWSFHTGGWLDGWRDHPPGHFRGSTIVRIMDAIGNVE